MTTINMVNQSRNKESAPYSEHYKLIIQIREANYLSKNDVLA